MHNLNRVWSAAELDGTADSPELERARALRPVVAAADHILDIHSTSQDVRPFWVYPQFERNAAAALAIGRPQVHLVMPQGLGSGTPLIQHGAHGTAEGGGVALVSQSGGLGSYLTTKGLLTGLQLGWFVSTGNELDVNIAAVLRYLVERPEVKVLLAFSETLRDPEVFIEAARRAQILDKPLVILKAGRSEAAAKAAMSHTASVVGAVDVFDAVCRQYGVIVAHSMEEMLDLGMIFQDGRRVQGNRLAIMTSSGGTGVLLADEASLSGLEVPTFPDDEQQQMLGVLHTPFFGSVANPVDTTAAVHPESITALQSLISATYALLGLRTYFTTGEKETRAWTILEGDKAPAAAGVIHSDFERGFIRAETIAYDDYVALGGEAKAREAGKLRAEGKAYVVHDGDVMHFLHS
mgnify:CR=1 FL=1